MEYLCIYIIFRSKGIRSGRQMRCSSLENAILDFLRSWEELTVSSAFVMWVVVPREEQRKYVSDHHVITA